MKINYYVDIEGLGIELSSISNRSDIGNTVQCQSNCLDVHEFDVWNPTRWWMWIRVWMRVSSYLDLAHLLLHPCALAQPQTKPMSSSPMTSLTSMNRRTTQCLSSCTPTLVAVVVCVVVKRQMSSASTSRCGWGGRPRGAGAAPSSSPGKETPAPRSGRGGSAASPRAPRRCPSLWARWRPRGQVSALVLGKEQGPGTTAEHRRRQRRMGATVSPRRRRELTDRWGKVLALADAEPNAGQYRGVRLWIWWKVPTKGICYSFHFQFG